MGSSKKRSKSSASKKKSNASNSTKDFQDVFTKLDKLRSSTKVEHSKVQHVHSRKNQQIFAVVAIIVVGSAGLLFLYNPNIFTNPVPPPTGGGIVSILGGFKEDTSVSNNPLFINNKISVVYVGAEYCPNCAVERWALVMALGQFGTFSNLGNIKSAEGSVPTYSFGGSSYSSSQVDFQPVEEYGNTYNPQTNYYNKINSLNTLQSTLFNKYADGYFPFICIGGCIFQVGRASNLNPSAFSKYSFNDIQSQISSKSGLYSVINAESTIISTLINQILAKRSTTTSPTSASNSSILVAFLDLPSYYQFLVTNILKYFF